MIKRFLCSLRDNRRGVAIELAMVTMLVVLALSGILVTTSALQNRQRLASEKRMQSAVEQKIVLSEIGERFCDTMLGADDAWLDTPNCYDGYVIAFSAAIGGDSNANGITVSRESDGAVVLELEVLVTRLGEPDADPGKICTITKWKEN